MTTEIQLPKEIENISVVELATKVNQLLHEKYPGTPLQENSFNIQKLFQEYNTENYLLIDSAAWQFYSLYYKDYFFHIPGAGMASMNYDPVKMEEALQRKYIWLKEELANK